MAGSVAAPGVSHSPIVYPGAMYLSPDEQTGIQRRDGRPQRKDVLVVDDEPYLCDLIADVLESEGHTSRKAAHGIEALERIRERKPQLILLDLMMPVMDGWELVEVLKSNEEWADIPVVIITAHYQVARAQKEIGASAVITKPFDIDQIGRVVDIYAS